MTILELIQIINCFAIPTLLWFVITLLQNDDDDHDGGKRQRQYAFATVISR